MNTLIFTAKRIRGGNITGLALCLGLSTPIISAEQTVDLSYPPAGSPTLVVNLEAGEVNGGETLSPEQTQQREQGYSRHHFIIDSKFEISWPNAPTEKMASSIPAPTAASPAAQSTAKASDQPNKDAVNQ